MTSQRARVAESRVRNRLSNGPPRVQSNALLRRVFCNVMRHTLVAGDMIVSRKVYGFAVNQGGTTDFYSSRTELISVGDFYFIQEELP